MTKHFALIFLLSMYVNAAARQQPQVPLLDLVTVGVEEQPEVKAAADQMKWFSANRYGAAFIDEMDVRFGGISTDKNEYAIRIKPTNPFLYAAGKNLGATLEDRARLKYLQLREEALYNRYVSWIEVWERASAIKKIEKGRQWRAQWSEAMQQLAGDDDFDPEQLLDIELDMLDMGIEEQAEVGKLDKELERFLSISHGYDSLLMGRDQARQHLLQAKMPALSAGKIRSIVDSLRKSTDGQPLELELLRTSLEETRRKILLEKADWDVGFVQPEWENDRSDNFSMRVGIGIPLFRGNRMQIQNRKIDLMEENGELLLAEAQWKLSEEREYMEIASLSERMISLENLAQKLEGFQQNIPLLEGKNASELLLKWLKAEEKLEEQKLEVQFLLLTAYLDYLKLRGLLNPTSAAAYFHNIWLTTSY